MIGHELSTAIRPICTCGCEVWVPCFTNIKMFEETNNYELFGKAPFEKLDLRFCKYTRNLATSIATRGELGRYPIIIYIRTLSIKYWLRLAHMENAVVKDAYLCNVEMTKNN